MNRTDPMSIDEYAAFVRRVVRWVQARQSEGVTTHWYTIRRRFRLTNDEVEMICGDSDAYGPQLMCHALGEKEPRGNTTVEVLA